MISLVYAAKIKNYIVKRQYKLTGRTDNIITPKRGYFFSN